MKSFVPGASRFVGANFVHELNARGPSVKALRREVHPQTNPKQALTDAVEWFRAQGYVKK